MDPKKNKIEIIPAILPEDFQELSDKVFRVHNLTPWVQVDVTDGAFVSSETWPYNGSDDEAIDQLLNQEVGLPFWQDVNYEFDLMLEDQLEEAQKWVECGAGRIIFHLEALKDVTPEQIQNFAEQNSVEVGIALNTTTNISLLEPFLDSVSVVQCMGIEKIGFQGQPFDERVLEQIKKIKSLRPEMIIEVDGAVNLDTARDLVEAGVTRLVVGSALFGSDDIKSTIDEFKNLLP